MAFVKFSFTSRPGERELLLAFLSQLPFDSFQEAEHPDQLDAYIAENLDDANLDQSLQSLKEQWQFRYQKERMPDQNWNALWESNFESIQVGNFCGIRADFHPSMDGVQYQIVINPKMAFGTGHHETTHMMVQRMAQLSVQGLRVLDYGCGTGLLAILAAQMGASEVEAVDIEQAAYDNSLENARCNGTPDIKIFKGDLSAVPPGPPYDLILANINRNVILNSLPSLYDRLQVGGRLITSGFVEQDRDLMDASFQQAGFRQTQQL
ncbi:MAG: 50S ribosomal protein L11 methyltransferase, partial [Bacteroidota bacterium]